MNNGTPQESLSLRKGQSLSLKKNNANLKHIAIGLGWTANTTGNVEFDLDASVFLLGSDKKVHRARHLVFFNNSTSPCGSVRHSGDDRVGNVTDDKNKDVEVIEIDLTSIPANVTELIPTITIYDAHARRQNFGQVSDAYIRIVDRDTESEVGRFDLTENSSAYCSNITARIYRDGDGWAFQGLDEGLKGEIEEVCDRFGWNKDLG
ncbi:TerD family protein (plasmid) [Aneurinibacillus sp. Ricciae_BoGa-3]|uniref:TerD family protein n=1 Tax=Aneurinibacillus sp. Ricciae_BoGa-3 TaxID=3022697 RepID=UPI0023404FD8|nr:TerD family protein [Aneurinibacillus sp. Ricciae_BoGa-3]WCK57521.1 TerD family protein [Aneurinibacillus sp. Ricciae_BoGa-3]